MFCVIIQKTFDVHEDYTLAKPITANNIIEFIPLYMHNYLEFNTLLFLVQWIFVTFCGHLDLLNVFSIVPRGLSTSRLHKATRNSRAQPVGTCVTDRMLDPSIRKTHMQIGFIRELRFISRNHLKCISWSAQRHLPSIWQQLWENLWHPVSALSSGSYGVCVQN